jgi:hypothetical protein
MPINLLRQQIAAIRLGSLAFQARKIHEAVHAQSRLDFEKRVDALCASLLGVWA